jgi:parallel beta-helix repeat protein
VYGNFGYGIDVDDSSTGVVVFNNISTGNGFAGIYLYAPEIVAESDNFTDDPGFVNAEGDDFRLRDGSPAIDAGSDVALYTDLVGTAGRPHRFWCLRKRHRRLQRSGLWRRRVQRRRRLPELRGGLRRLCPARVLW